MLGTRTPSTSLSGLYWGEYTPVTKARVILTLIVLPIFAGFYGLIEWTPVLTDPWGGYAGFAAGTLLGFLIRPRKQAAR